MNLELKTINKSFSEKHVLKGISLKAESGKALGLLGRNGAGKTTTIRIIMGVFPFDSGEVLINGKPIDRNKISIGYLPEERGLYPKRKVIEQLVYLANLKGMKTKDAVKAVDYWLDRLGMSEYRNKKLDTLSKGNQQKIQLITAISYNPDIVILDEPFSGLDPVNAQLLKDVVHELISKDKIVIFSSHQMNYIQEFCDDISIINSGEIAIGGSIKSIIRSYPRNKLVVSSPNIDKISREIKLENKIIKDKLIITLDKESDKGKFMSDICNDYDIDSVSVYEPTLSDIFVEYTKDEITEGKI